MHKLHGRQFFFIVVDEIASKIQYINSYFQVIYTYILLKISTFHQFLLIPFPSMLILFSKFFT